MSALLNGADWDVDEQGTVVWLVCRGWGVVTVVHAAGMFGGERTQVSHSGIHSRRCDRWGDRAQSFLVSGRLSAL
jgi:hypothetical protein